MLMRWDPFREFDRLAGSLVNDARTPRAMPMDAYRKGDDLFVHLDLPGVDAESIELTVEQNVLDVTARRTFDRTESAEFILSERPQGVFNRQIFLGEGLDPDALEASYDHGVLSVRIPVRESAKPRRIPVSVTDGGRTSIGAGESAA